MRRSTPREREEDNELARRIQAAGVPIAIDAKEDELPELLIRQDIEGAYESALFDIGPCAGLTLPLRVTPGMPLFVFSGFDVRLDRWPQAWFRPLEENARNEWPHYQFFNERPWLKFDRSEVINRFMTERKQFHRGQPFQGLLLAFSYDPIPDDIILGELLRGSIAIQDQFENEHSIGISLRVDRTVGRKPETLRRRPSIFSRRDPS
jgi:hypothetical protein